MGTSISQSQSLNLFVGQPNFGKLSSMHFYTSKKGLRAGMYHLRTKAAADTIKFKVDADVLNQSKDEQQAAISCSLDNLDACEACGS